MILVVIGLALIGGVGRWWFRSKRGKDPTFHTVPVKRGDLVATISATGTLEPEAAVDIGAQVAGVIIAFGKDKGGKEIQWGSVVEKGMVLAKIDDSLYAAAVGTAKGQLEQAVANKVSADANVLQMKAKLVDAEQDWGRAQRLGPSDALSQSAYDQYQANYEVAKANLAATEATVEQTKAAVEQAKASLDTAQINLDYCTVKSPVNGVVVDRQVNIGQTVVSSLSTPNLFIIATDLKRIQAWVSVNEADIGSIFIGQPVTFTVDAYPGRVFQGQVGQVRLNATMVQNVVTYTVRVDTNNDDGKLLPYLTTNGRFKIGRRQGVLLVPNAALHWSPKPTEIAAGSAKTSRASGVSSTRDSEAGSETVGAAKTHGTVWVEQGEFVRPVQVSVGLTDGTSTEVEGAELSEEMRVVVGEATREVAGGPSTERSPFTPQIGRGLRQGQGSSDGASGGR
ncbi:MAG TPA: efflux RND transporter periplasmic adaptor subunit [Thermodesulfobacteriota bacterium]|nr:efflux RND transporter periplasmic adaptor subunit [Thermodesulfobacteriota bacterium]